MEFVLDGSGSHAGVGDDAPLTYAWGISGPASIVGPADGPTVRIRAESFGPVTVQLTVSDGKCQNPVVAMATAIIDTHSDLTWLRCDANGDGEHDVSDAVYVIYFMFLGGPAGGCPGALDCDGDGGLDLTDPVSGLNYLFLGGPPPRPPYPACEHFPGCGESACRSER